MQRAYFPMNVINLTQGYGSKSSTHKYSYALDFAGTQDVYAPFDCKITKLYQPSDTKNHANTVWLTSTKKVLCPNGYYGYLTVSFTHPSEISKMKKGTKFKQGEKVCTTSKMTGNATGNHLHLEVGLGKNCSWEEIKNNWVMTNKVKPEQYLYVKKDSVVKDNEYKSVKYNFIKEDDTIKKYVYNVDDEGLVVRKEPGGKETGKLLKTATKVQVYENNGYWSRIGENEWVWSFNLSDKEPSYKKVFNVKNPPLNVRDKPSTEKGKIIGSLNNGDKVQVYETKDGWAKVSKDDERWVAGNYLK